MWQPPVLVILLSLLGYSLLSLPRSMPQEPYFCRLHHPGLPASWHWIGFANERHRQKIGREEEWEEGELATSFPCSFAAPACVSGSSLVSHDYSLTQQPLLRNCVTLGSSKTISFPCSLVLGWRWLPTCQSLAALDFNCFFTLSCPLLEVHYSVSCANIIIYEFFNYSTSVWLLF